MIKVGDKYKHYKKGTIYVVTGFVQWEPTNEEAVCYTEHNAGEEVTIWARPVSVFTELVFHAGSNVPRFAKIDS